MYNNTISGVEAISEPMMHKMKKPNIFKRWLLKSLKDAHTYENEQVKVQTAQVQIRKHDQIDQPDRSIQFTVYAANGGRVVETRKYDRNKDRSHTNLYVVTNDQEFGKEIDKIITMESLRG